MFRFKEWLTLAFTACVLNYVSASLKLSHVSTIYLPNNITSTGEEVIEYLSAAVEQVSYHPGDRVIYAVGSGVIHVVNVADPTNMIRERSIFLNGYDLTDVEVCGDYVMITADNLANRAQGELRVYRKFSMNDVNSMSLLHTVYVGPIPDMLEPRSDCQTVVIAQEGEGYVDNNGVFQDPEGSVVIVKFVDGIESSTAPTVKRLDFRSFNSRYESTLKATGVRFVYRMNNNQFSNDVEPEYVAIDEVDNKAYISLQENNAIAEVDLNTETITNIHGLGYKQWGVLDASDRDKGIEMTYWPIRAWYLPDTAKFHQWNGRKLVFTANEGDAKEYDSFTEEMRGQDITSLGNVSAMIKTAFAEETQLGRLKLSSVDGKNSLGQYDAVYAYGGRSFSIWDADNNFELLFDSENEIEKHTALLCPHLFNTNGENVDDRSDDKGPETESLEVAEIMGRLYIFVGNERPGTIIVYSIGSDVTKPKFEQLFCDGNPNNGKTLSQKFEDRQLYAMDPEDLKFYDIDKSPVNYPILIVAGAVSSTISILRVEATAEPVDPNPNPNPEPDTTIPTCRPPTDTDDYNSASHIAMNLPAVLICVLLNYFYLF